MAQAVGTRGAAARHGPPPASVGRRRPQTPPPHVHPLGRLPAPRDRARTASSRWPSRSSPTSATSIISRSSAKRMAASSSRRTSPRSTASCSRRRAICSARNAWTIRRRCRRPARRRCSPPSPPARASPAATAPATRSTARAASGKTRNATRSIPISPCSAASSSSTATSKKPGCAWSIPSSPVSTGQSDFELHEEWYSLKNFAPDLHVILAQDTKGMKNFDYDRPNYPATWAASTRKAASFSRRWAIARMSGKARSCKNCSSAPWRGRSAASRRT